MIRTLFAALFITTTAAAQGSAADYQRVRDLREDVNGTVQNLRIEPTWLDASTFVYRVRHAGGEWTFVRIDADRGVKEPLFDHALAAAALEADERRLPIDRVWVHEGTTYLAASNGRFLRVRDDGAVIGVDAADLPRERLEPTDVRRSRDGGGDARITVDNQSDETIKLIWLDREGGRQAYATIDPGEQHSQHTFIGHAWLIEGLDGFEFGRYRARTRSSAINFTAAKRTATPRENRPRRRPGTSPDGAHRVEVRNHNLALIHIESGELTWLTEDGEESNRYSSRVSWAPDSKSVATLRIEPSETHTVHFVESSPDDQIQPKLHSFDYLKPGGRIEHAEPCLFDIETTSRIPVDSELFSTPWRINDLSWSDDGSELRFVYNERGHRVYRMVGVDARTGAVRALAEETPATFVDYAAKTYHRFIGDDLIWMSERSGWNHLYAVDVATAAIRPLTSGEWVVRGVEHVDDETREITIRLMGERTDQDPYHVQYARVNIDDGAITRLTEGDGTHSIAFGPQRRYYVDTWSRVDHPPVHELRRASDGALVMTLEQTDWSALLETGWTAPERFAAPGRDGETEIWGVIFRPSNFDPTKTYPVVEQIYAGPHGHHVPKSFRAWRLPNELAELGFIVVQIDGMGTNWRSKAFHDVAWKNLGDAGFPDRIAWIKAAAETRPWMDLDRVGIYGGSAGGQNALRGMLFHGDFYDAAVADCGCHDNRMDKIWWNELWMSWPIDEHYAESSNVTHAHRLEGELLLIVGELDRNVDPASTMQVVDALIKADKDFDLLVMPGVGHGAAESPYGKRRRQDFFVRHLLGVEPRWKP